MKYMLLFFDPSARAGGEDAMTGEIYQRIERWWGEHAAAGRITAGAQLQPASTATLVRFEGDTPVLSDGPMLEAKEVVGGYALIEVPDLDAALEMAKTWPGRYAVEVRPVVSR